MQGAQTKGSITVAKVLRLRIQKPNGHGPSAALSESLLKAFRPVF